MIAPNIEEKINKRRSKMTVEEVVAEIKTYADSIEAHMDEGGEINRENEYDMCKHINILHQLYTINAKAFDDVGKKIKGIKNDRPEQPNGWSNYNDKF